MIKMALEDHISKKEKKILKQIGEDYSRAECLQIWEQCRAGLRKSVPRGFWRKHKHREYVFFEFLKEFQEANPDKIYPDTNNYTDKRNKLLGFYKLYASPIEVLKDMSFTNLESEYYDKMLDKTPWLVLDVMPNAYWKDKNNQVLATKWLVEYLGKPPEQVSSADFKDNGLRTLLKYFPSIHKILVHAGYDIKLHEMVYISRGGWSGKEAQVAAIVDLATKLKKRPEELLAKDFKENGLHGLLCKYESSPIKLLKECGFNMSEEVRMAPQNTWSDKKNRAQAVRKLSEELGRTPNSEDFKKYLVGITPYGTTAELLEDAGLE